MDLTLQVSLKHLKILNSASDCRKITATLTFESQTKTIPNPRFVRNMEANFYSSKLELEITSTPWKRNHGQATLEVKAVYETFNKILGSFPVELVKLQEHKAVSCLFQNHDITLTAQVLMIKNEKSSYACDSGFLSSSFALDGQDNHQSLQDIQGENTATRLFPNKSKVSYTVKTDCSRQNHSNHLETLSDYGHQKSIVSGSNRQKSKTMMRQNSVRSGRGSDYGDYNFIEPITHTPSRTSRSPKISPIKLIPRVNYPEKQAMQTSRIVITKVNFSKYSLLKYSLLCCGSFILGTIVRQGLPF